MKKLLSKEERMANCPAETNSAYALTGGSSGIADFCV